MTEGHRLRFVRHLLAIAWFGLCAAGTVAAADVDHATFWAARDDANASAIDHAPWQQILDLHLRAAHPSGVNRFDYAALKANATQGQTLAGYLQALQAIDPRRHSGAEQKAYWINFYNALTVKVVADAFPVESIRDIGGSWLNPGPWDEPHAKVAGRELSLNDIEHEILRPVWQDNRIHYAVNCASFGCPNLASKAYSAANTEQLLEDGARAYVNHPRGVAFADGDLIVSRIYDWYQEDFGDDEQAVLEHLAKYAAPQLAAWLRDFDGYIDYAYDWTLNAP